MANAVITRDKNWKSSENLHLNQHRIHEHWSQSWKTKPNKKQISVKSYLPTAFFAPQDTIQRRRRWRIRRRGARGVGPSEWCWCQIIEYGVLTAGKRYRTESSTEYCTWCEHGEHAERGCSLDWAHEERIWYQGWNCADIKYEDRHRSIIEKSKLWREITWKTADACLSCFFVAN